MPDFFTISHHDPRRRSGTVINQGRGAGSQFCLHSADRQEQDGVVNTGTPTVSDLNTNGAGDVLRRTGMIAPSGGRVDFRYGACGNVTDVSDQGAFLMIAGDSDDPVANPYAAIGPVAILTFETRGRPLPFPLPADNALVARRWRDASGNVMKETFQGIEGFVKRTFDAFDQILRSYSACNPTGGSNDNHPANDTVVEQTETLYDSAGNTVQSIAWQRFHDATGNGPLNGPTGPDPKARQTYACFWQDAIGRGIASADYGTNGGAILLRPEIPPPTSEEVLVTVTRYATTGEPGEVIAADGTVTRTKRNALGQEIETIGNFNEGAAPAADVNRTTRFSYHPSGGLETLTLVNDVTGDQVTRWVYGTTLTDSGVATGHLLRAKIYPESDDANAPLGNGPDGIYERTEHTYNRQGEVVTTKDPNETVHTYERNQLGQLIHDRITAFGPGVNQTIKRVTITFDAKRPALTTKVTCFDHAIPGSGSVVNEVGFTYDGLGQQTKDRQAHGGVVIPGSTPEVGYSYETP